MKYPNRKAQTGQVNNGLNGTGSQKYLSKGKSDKGTVHVKRA